MNDELLELIEGQRPRAPGSMTTQSLVLAKSRFKTMAAASKWIREHGFKVRHKGKAPDETKTSFRYRQRDPGDFQAGSFRTVRVDQGISMVVGRLKATKAIAHGSPNSAGVVDDLGAEVLDLIT